MRRSFVAYKALMNQIPVLPSGVSTGETRSRRAIGIWLLVIAGMIAVMVVIGGLTRLTGSGLSITEWHPVTGIVPPMSDADWQSEFAKYRGTPQYDLLNRGMGLESFKTIYWWEWTHRFFGRLIGFVFAIPFLYFAIRRRIDRKLAVRLLILFGLGAAQGVLGWWMVKSGLEPMRVAVSQYRLAAHLGLAMALFGYALWIAFELLGLRRSAKPDLALMRPFGFALPALIFLQILLGAFMAGIDAGRAFADWPTYAGRWVPPGMFDLDPWWINHFENPALVHFQHRTLGYAIAVFATLIYIALRGSHADRAPRMAAIHMIVIVGVQVWLGILTVINMVPIGLAAAHQIAALVLFGAALWLVYVLPSRARAGGELERAGS
jgi:cytochrome c oxidase assembly protein subunit 15